METQLAPTVETQAHAPGTFCWWDIATPDEDAAARFYSALFGWTYERQTMPDGKPYTMLRHQGKDLGGFWPLDAAQQEQGIPPHWFSYIATDNADATAEKVLAHGGKVVMAPFDVLEAGRMAICQEPSGASFGLWQAKQHPGVGILDEPGAVCWNELASRDAAASKAFFAAVFGYTLQESEVGGTPYTVLQDGEAMRGGVLQMTAEWGDTPSHFMTYVAVTDCDTTAARITELGGNVCVPPTDIPGIGRFAVANDPLGATFSILTAVPPQN
jgi:hypothetical protein